jgi:hypothetical protein
MERQKGRHRGGEAEGKPHSGEIGLGERLREGGGGHSRGEKSTRDSRRLTKGRDKAENTMGETDKNKCEEIEGWILEDSGESDR